MKPLTTRSIKTMNGTELDNLNRKLRIYNSSPKNEVDLVRQILNIKAKEFKETNQNRFKSFDVKKFNMNAKRSKMSRIKNRNDLLTETREQSGLSSDSSKSSDEESETGTETNESEVPSLSMDESSDDDSESDYETDQSEKERLEDLDIKMKLEHLQRENEILRQKEHEKQIEEERERIIKDAVKKFKEEEEKRILKEKKLEEVKRKYEEQQETLQRIEILQTEKDRKSLREKEEMEDKIKSMEANHEKEKERWELEESERRQNQEERERNLARERETIRKERELVNKEKVLIEEKKKKLHKENEEKEKQHRKEREDLMERKRNDHRTQNCIKIDLTEGGTSSLNRVNVFQQNDEQQQGSECQVNLNPSSKHEIEMQSINSNKVETSIEHFEPDENSKMIKIQDDYEGESDNVIIPQGPVCVCDQHMTTGGDEDICKLCRYFTLKTVGMVGSGTGNKSLIAKINDDDKIFSGGPKIFKFFASPVHQSSFSQMRKVFLNQYVFLSYTDPMVNEEWLDSLGLGQLWLGQMHDMKMNDTKADGIQMKCEGLFINDDGSFLVDCGTELRPDQPIIASVTEVYQNLKVDPVARLVTVGVTGMVTLLCRNGKTGYKPEIGDEIGVLTTTVDEGLFESILPNLIPPTVHKTEKSSGSNQVPLKKSKSSKQNRSKSNKTVQSFPLKKVSKVIPNAVPELFRNREDSSSRSPSPPPASLPSSKSKRPARISKPASLPTPVAAPRCRACVTSRERLQTVLVHCPACPTYRLLLLADTVVKASGVKIVDARVEGLTGTGIKMGKLFSNQHGAFDLPIVLNRQNVSPTLINHGGLVSVRLNNTTNEPFSLRKGFVVGEVQTIVIGQ